MKMVLISLAAWSALAGGPLQEIRERGAAFEAQRQWSEAARLYRSELAKLGSAGRSEERLWLIASLVEVSFERQDYSEARRWLREEGEALAGRAADSPERVRLLSASGTLHLVEGNLIAAERDLRQAVAISESVAMPVDLAAALHNLAAVEMRTVHLEEAMAHETRALGLWRRQLGDRHYYVMKAWISLSSLQGLRGDWPDAEQSLKNALAIAETPEALANYAVVLEKLKRRAEAKAIRRRLGRNTTPPSSNVVDIRALAYESSGLSATPR